MTGGAVGELSVVKLLFTAYAVPARFAYRFAGILRAEGPLRLARAFITDSWYQCAMNTGSSASARIFEVAPPKIIWRRRELV